MQHLLTSCTWHIAEIKGRLNNARDCVFNFLAGDFLGDVHRSLIGLCACYCFKYSPKSEEKM